MCATLLIEEGDLRPPFGMLRAREAGPNEQSRLKRLFSACSEALSCLSTAKELSIYGKSKRQQQ
jgi:hypothetical protein